MNCPTRCSTEWRPRQAAYQFGSQRGAAIGELGVRTHGKSMRAPMGMAIVLKEGELTISEKSLVLHP